LAQLAELELTPDEAILFLGQIGRNRRYLIPLRRIPGTIRGEAFSQR
jgi:hypothetical protein